MRVDILCKRALLICLSATLPTLASAQVASAQDATGDVVVPQEGLPAPQSPDPGHSQLEDVEVVAPVHSQTNRIDRRVYDVARDPLSQSSTALEVIGRLPSVSVSSSGSITLLGQGAATILIDGKPAANVEALRVLQGSDLDRVEVMTNPSAEFRAQGTGGVVNVITRRRRPIGLSGNVLGSAGTLGDMRLSLSTSTTVGRLTITGNVLLEEAASQQDRSLFRDAFSPAIADVSETSAFRQSGNNAALGVAATYAFDERRSLTWGGTIGHVRAENRNAFARTLSGSISTEYEEVLLGSAVIDTADANIEYSFRSLDDRLLAKISGTISSNDFLTEDIYVRTPNPSAPQQLFGMSSRYSTDKASLAASVEYDGANELVLKAGVAFDTESQLISRLTDVGLPGAESGLSGDTRLWAAYGSLQWPMSGWTVMPGLRMERSAHEIDDTALDREDEIDLFPSLHLRRPISADWNLNLSYSRRVNRPDLGRLDPRPVFSSATDVSVGSPDLAPEFTDAFEARVEYASGDNNASATLYRRITSDVWQASFNLNAEQIIVQTFINAGTRANTGLELSLRRALSERYRILATANVFHAEQDVLVSGSLAREGFVEFSMNLAMSFKPHGSDPMSDTFQWSLRYSGESQGYQTTSSAVFQSGLSWRRPITRRLVSVLTISDLFDSGDQTFVLTTPEFEQRLQARGDGPQLRWTLSYRFGGGE